MEGGGGRPSPPRPLPSEDVGSQWEHMRRPRKVKREEEACPGKGREVQGGTMVGGWLNEQASAPCGHGVFTPPPQ